MMFLLCVGARAQALAPTLIVAQTRLGSGATNKNDSHHALICGEKTCCMVHTQHEKFKKNLYHGYVSLDNPPFAENDEDHASACLRGAGKQVQVGDTVYASCSVCC